jgi:hypothetical protein
MNTVAKILKKRRKDENKAVLFHTKIHKIIDLFNDAMYSVNADQIKENEVGGTCDTHRRGEECVQGFDGKARRKEATCKTKA